MRITILLVLLLGFCRVTNAQSGNNSLQGKILIPEISDKTLSRGTGYKPEALTEEKKRLDRLNAPEKNIYISLHPVNFVPELQPTDVQITQRSKTFLPNFIAITQGSKVYFLNEDEHYHNIHSLTPRARFNIGRRPPGNVYAQKITKVGLVQLGCDIHAEMAAVVLSLDTPYFTKISADGTYELDHLPDGQYELRAFHPLFQPYKEQIQLEQGKVVNKDINLRPRT